MSTEQHVSIFRFWQYLMPHFDKDKGVFLQHSFGGIATHAEVNELINGLLEFYLRFNAEELKEFEERHLAWQADGDRAFEEAQAKRNFDKKNAGGFVYLLSSEYGEHKIGRTTDLKTRISSFRTLFPFKTELIHSFQVSNADRAEKYLHARFAHCRRKGEWFALHPDEVAWITSIPDLDTLAEEAA